MLNKFAIALSVILSLTMVWMPTAAAQRGYHGNANKNLSPAEHTKPRHWPLGALLRSFRTAVSVLCQNVEAAPKSLDKANTANTIVASSFVFISNGCFGSVLELVLERHNSSCAKSGSARMPPSHLQKEARQTASFPTGNTVCLSSC